MDQHYHIQLALSTSRGAGSGTGSRGSGASATPPPAAKTTRQESQPADGSRVLVTAMCTYLHLSVYKGEMVEVMELLPKQHVAAARLTGELIVNLEEKELEAVFETGIILRHGQCSIHEVTAGGNTVLHVAAAQGHHELIQEIYLRFRDHEGLLCRRNSALDTPLHCAARAGHARAVTILAKLAQDCGDSILGFKNEAGDTALHLAARHGHGAAVEALVSEAAAAGEVNNAGVSALYLAVISRSVRAARAIMTCRDASCAGPSSQNALHAAVFQSSEMVELLLEWKPTLVEEVDSWGSTPLHFAASDGGDPNIVRAILRAAPPRAMLYKKDSGGLSALHVAARMGHAGVVVDIVRSCPDVIELRDDDGRTFVHTAAKEKRSTVVSVATSTPFQRGNLDAQDRDGNTPLHVAVAAGAPGVVEDLLRKGKVRADVLNNDGHTAFDLAAGSASFFTMVSLVVTLVAYGARLGPQRRDHLKPWRGSDGVAWIDKTADSLAVVAVLIATSAFAAGFNLPGGYSDATATGGGEAVLARKVAFKCFLCLDTVAVATSVVAVVVLVYGKASRSAGSWKSFVLALHCMWVSLVSLLLALYAALVAVVSARAAFFYVLLAIYAAIYFLSLFIVKWIGPDTKLRTVWRFLYQLCRSKQRHVIRRQYPLAGATVLNLILFSVTSFLSFVGIGFILGTSQRELRLATSSPSPAPSPL